jgi:hypothetical protein
MLPGPALSEGASTWDVCALARELNAFIAASSPLVPSESCPTVTFDLPQMPSGAPRSQAGAYDPSSGTIALAPDLDLLDPIGRSFLLHELVHAAQFRVGRQHEVACRAMLEAEAYQLQAEFLRAAGSAREALMTSLVGQQLGRCTAIDEMY